MLSFCYSVFRYRAPAKNQDGKGKNIFFPFLVLAILQMDVSSNPTPANPLPMTHDKNELTTQKFSTIQV